MFALSPIMIIGSSLEMEFATSQNEMKDDYGKEAALMCGDAIVNFKTVQSFGHEEKVMA